MFGAVRYADRRAALFAPLLALLASDLAREALYRYGLAEQWGLYRGMWVVYGATALIALTAGPARGTRSPGVIASITLAGSCLFFLLTNFAVWAGGSLYPRTGEGLAACYTAAIPFFRNSVAGDLCFAVILFGGFALLEKSVVLCANRSRFISSGIQDADRLIARERDRNRLRSRCRRGFGRSVA